MLQRIRDWLGRAENPVDGAAKPPAGIVVTLPREQEGVLRARLEAPMKTDEVFRDLLGRARDIVKIFSPYVDPTFTSLAEAARAPIRIVTTVREGRIKSNPVLERLSTMRPVSVRYLHEKRGGSQMFQLHAKMILCDRAAAYVGSANFTDTSLRYNLELGLYIEEGGVIADLHRLFDHVFDCEAVPMRT
ncbi:MAG: hypothetical protein HYY17_01930 [Planctomycetes bacterium]|nr:hypothetical protein [Planctomycetota bacterium]